MGKAKRKVAQCRLNARRSRLDRDQRLEAKRFAFSIIVTGSEITKAINLLVWNDITIPFSKSELYREMEVVCNAIKKYAIDSMNNHFMNMQP